MVCFIGFYGYHNTVWQYCKIHSITYIAIISLHSWTQFRIYECKPTDTTVCNYITREENCALLGYYAASSGNFLHS